jgi:two-component system, NarL family, sensor histidine kinase DegS
MPSKDSATPEPGEELQQQIQSELDHNRKAVKEVSMMLEQSQTEMAKLTQRSAAITGHLQQVQAQFDTMPRADIRNAYNAALDAQQRLLVMRGQVEKLQSDHNHMVKYIQLLEKTQGLINEGALDMSGKKAQKVGSQTLEMVIKAQEAERQRLSRQMHDGPAQALSNFIVQTEIATRLFDLDASRAKEELNNLKAAAMTTFQKVRVFIFELRPMMLDDLGLYPTIRRYVDAFKEQTGLEVNVNLKGSERRFEPYLEVMVFRALQELMGNAARHNEDFTGKLQLTINVVPDDNVIKVSVQDNGKGFDPSIIENNSGLGLKLIKERSEMLGGYLEIDSAPGQGCRVTFQVPCLDFEKAIL